MERTTTNLLAEPDRHIIHQANNFLALCLAHGEMALESDDNDEHIDALATILEGAREMADWLAAHRRTLEATRRTHLRPVPSLGEVGAQPAMSQDWPVSPDTASRR
jgi:hypothetical protein